MLKKMSSITAKRHINYNLVKLPRYNYNKLKPNTIDSLTNKPFEGTEMDYALRQFTGPKDYKGDYIYNKYYFPPVNNIPNYLHADLELGNPLRLKQTGEVLTFSRPETNEVELGSIQKYINGNPVGRAISNESFIRNSYYNAKDKETQVPRFLQPFALNPYCKTNSLLSDDLKQAIRNAMKTGKVDAGFISTKLSLKVNKVNAVNRLLEAEEDLVERKLIDEDMESFAETMKGMLPIYDPVKPHKNPKLDAALKTNGKDDLDELPSFKELEKSKFISIPEGNSFTNLDAANVLFLQPADKVINTLKAKETETNEDEGLEERRFILGKKYVTDRFDFHFVDVKVGEVGKRYGTGNRDNRKDKQYTYDMNGKMVYL